MKIAVLGNKNNVLPFKALGCEIFCIEKKDDFNRAKEEIETSDDFAILFVSQQTANDYQGELADFYNKPLPAVLVLPGKEQDQGLNKIFERALGRKI